ncbi:MULTISPECIES: TniQ family protein [Methylomonas]|uniref:TniQ domain-containing protein n=2 Tax=Methylomonas TaxID=416 RepID=A0A126T4F2_9GAMM|nr:MULTISPECIES: TniQ family protein [Methylomonas]AMK76930.1 hypothetical protein JT25_010595 [Methylomonas denitrificans]OAH96729.1 hypothetical protein A1342_21815 [Methylomonas methanica]TCV73159.1 TniQ protein [Methylomonas methanica]
MNGTQLTLICPPLRTKCHADENPVGYLMRLADTNTYSSYRWLLKGQGVDTVDFEKLYQTYLEAGWTGFQHADSKLAQICALPNIHLISARLRYCPLCLQEENYWRIGWQIKWSVACSRHQVWLQDLCPDCHKEHSFLKARESQRKCLEHLTQAEAIQAPSSIVRKQRFLEDGILEFENHLFNTDHMPTLLQRCELLEFMVKWLQIGEDAAKPSRHKFQYVTDVKVVAGQCAEALFSDKSGFWRYLQTIHLTRASAIGIQQKRLVQFYRQFFNEFTEPPFQRLKEIVEQYATINLIRDITEKHTLFSNNAKKSQLWYSFNRACNEYDIASSVLTRAIIDKQVTAHYEKTSSSYTKCAIYRPDLEKVLPHLNELITARRAAQILGVTKAQFAQLQNSGCFKFEVPPREEYCPTWQYSKLELETVIENINRGAATVTDDCMVLSLTLQNHIRGSIEMPFRRVFKAIVSGQLIVRKPDDKICKLGDLWLDKTEFTSWLKKLRRKSDALSVTQAAKVLGINEEFCYQLVNGGYLNHKINSNNAKVIFPDHIRQFRQEYVILSKLSNESRLTSGSIMELLQDLGVYPVDYEDYEKLRQKLYVRADVLKSTKLLHYVQHLPETGL